MLKINAHSHYFGNYEKQCTNRVSWRNIHTTAEKRIFLTDSIRINLRPIEDRSQDNFFETIFILYETLQLLVYHVIL